MAIELISEIKQKNNGKFPLIDSNNIRGGLYQVENEIEMKSIPEERLKLGTLCYVLDLGIYFKYSANNVWSKYNDSLPDIPKNSIPILDQGMISKLDPSELPEKYISIPEDGILDGEVVNNTYTTTNNGNYIDILFSAIRSLLSEVARLKNSFKYGINSYNDDKTAMSESLGSIENPDEEPLWAVEEDSLSELHDCTITTQNCNEMLLGSGVKADLINNEINISGIAIFNDPTNPKNGFKDQKDPKSFIFLTTTSKNITINLNSLESGNDDKLIIDLEQLKSQNYSNTNVEKYNILVIISKKTTKSKTDPKLYGNNYIWIQISDYKTDEILMSGYYNKTNILSGELYSLNYNYGYYINSIEFKDLTLSKFNTYTKYQDFSQEVIPTYPNDNDYKFGAAHLTIRSVKNENILKNVSEYLLNSELVWVENTKKLYIKSDNQIIEIGSNSKHNDDMTTEELIGMLTNLGIVVAGKENDYSLELNNLTGITFIHQDTGKKFNIEIDSEGKLRSTLEDNDTLKSRLEKITLPKTGDTRGFISRLLIGEYNKDNPGALFDHTGNAGLNSDRLKIGSIYAPIKRDFYGCSHAFVELENTSIKPFNLKGCYLHAAIKKGSTTKIYTLPLTGTIPAGGTYLIRGKQYAEFNDKNTVLKVKTYDQEWYTNGELIDFVADSLNFLLIYDAKETSPTDTYVKMGAKKTIWAVLDTKFIDYAPVRSRLITDWIGDAPYLVTDEHITRDYILKNTFELDPARQAFQAIYEKDCSRIRGKNKNDFKPFYIDTPTISFPHSKETYDVSKYTPKASFEHKNVSTDKSKLDTEKPNMVYCSFGIDVHKTRCFNWVSVGSFDEYIWVRTQGTLDWERFESYNEFTETPSNGKLFSRSVLTQKINDSVYKRMQGRFPGDGSFYTAHKCILNLNKPSGKQTFEYCVGRSLIDGNPDPDHTSEIMQFTIYPENTKARIYQITDQQGFYWIEYQTWAGSAEVIYNKIKEDLKKDSFIPVIINTGDMTQNGTRVNEWLDYYRGGYCLFKEFEHMSVVGNNDLCNTNPDELGTGDDYGKSNGYYHHLFQCFEINDPRLIVNGKYVPSTYYFECKTAPEKYERIICIDSEITFINCRDWFGLEGPDENSAYNIYTGWLVGKDVTVEKPQYSKASELFTPIYNILYEWMDAGPQRRITTACHEMPFTVMTSANLKANPNTTGYTERSRSLDGSSGSLIGSHLNQITPVDNIANYWFSRLLEHFGIKLCIGGHKHTYTCSYPVREFYFYNDGLLNSLKDGPIDMGPTLEDEYDTSTGKHRISWKYTKSDESLLKNNNGTFTSTSAPFNSFIPDNVLYNTSRLPIVKFNGTMQKITSGSSGFITAPYSNDNLSADSEYLPIVGNPNLENGVTYFMCQATGYKLTSNKELPGSSLAFTQLLPLTTYNSSKNKEEASLEQQAPMFGIVKLDDNITIQLARVMNIQAGLKKPLYNNSGEFATISDVPYLEYIDSTSGDYIGKRYGTWNTTDTNKVTELI